MATTKKMSKKAREAVVNYLKSGKTKEGECYLIMALQTEKDKSTTLSGILDYKLNACKLLKFVKVFEELRREINDSLMEAALSAVLKKK